MAAPRWLWPSIIGVSSVAVAILFYGDFGGPIRALVAFWFLAICPGMAVVRLLRLRDPWMEVALGTGASFALDVVVATTLLYFDRWSAGTALAILLVLCLAGATLQLRDPNPTPAKAAEIHLLPIPVRRLNKATEAKGVTEMQTTLTLLRHETIGVTVTAIALIVLTINVLLGAHDGLRTRKVARTAALLSIPPVLLVGAVFIARFLHLMGRV